MKQPLRHVIKSDKNWFFISAIFAIISNVVYFIQNEIFSRSEFDKNSKKIKKVRSTKKVCNALSIVGILLSGAVFCVNYLVLQNEIIVCIERTIYTLVVFTPTAISLSSVFFVCFAKKRAKKSGVKYVVQPGGSIRDDLVIECADKYGMAMAFTGMRLFHH